MMAVQTRRRPDPWHGAPGRLARRIPQEFCDLVAAAMQFVPPLSLRAGPDEREQLRLAVDAALATGGADWPPPAKLLLEAAASVVVKEIRHIERPWLQKSLDAHWPPQPFLHPPSWRLRRDLADDEFSEGDDDAGDDA